MLEQVLERYQATGWDPGADGALDGPATSHDTRRAEDDRMKAAVAATLQPETILEIGVRDGAA